MTRLLPACAWLLLLGACRPTISADDFLLAQRDPACALEPTPGPLDEATQTAIHLSGRGIGQTRAVVPALSYTERQTHDGYLVRRSAANLVMALAGVGIGALVAALCLAFFGRRPRRRWSEQLGQSISREIAELRALAAAGDTLARTLIQRLDEPLQQAAKKAQQLVSRALPLARREDSATAVAHLDSLEHQLEGLLARVERIHLQILMWNERQLHAEDEAVKSEVAAAIAELTGAFEEAR